MDGAGFIVAIHPDPRAPIFELADLCVEGAPEEVLPLLLDSLA
jgi:electron transfer flavoprotein alpha subunit